MTLATIGEAQVGGARLQQACEVAGISARTVERWRESPNADDGRHDPFSAAQATRSRLWSRPHRRGHHEPAVWPGASQTARAATRRRRHLPRVRIDDVPAPAPLRGLPTDPHASTQSRYPSHHSSLRDGFEQGLVLGHHVLPNARAGTFPALVLVLDVWSRRIVGWKIHERESDELAAEMIRDICEETNIDPNGLVLHSDNGKPMRGSTISRPCSGLASSYPSAARMSPTTTRTPRRSSGP
jgi:putative transposase